MSLLGKAIFRGALAGTAVGFAVKGCMMLYDAYKTVKKEIETEPEVTEDFTPVNFKEDLELSEDPDEVVIFKDPQGPDHEPTPYHKNYKGVSISRINEALTQKSPEELAEEDQVEAELNEMGEEDAKLPMRVDKNSEDALHLYKEHRMRNVETYAKRVIWRLFDYSFVVDETADYHDANLHETLREYRVDFFGGECEWTKPEYVSMAELIVHYSELLAADLDISVDDVMQDILFNCFSEVHDDGKIRLINMDDHEEISLICINLNKHNFDGEYGFGLFGLDDNEVDPTIDSYLKESNTYVGVKMEEIAKIEQNEEDFEA